MPVCAMEMILSTPLQLTLSTREKHTSGLDVPQKNKCGRRIGERSEQRNEVGVLTGKQVHLNGRPLDANTMHKISTFVEQEDALLGVLTVRETISYALRLQYV